MMLHSFWGTLQGPKNVVLSRNHPKTAPLLQAISQLSHLLFHRLIIASARDELPF